MPDLTDAVLLAATVWPGEKTAEILANEVKVNAKDVSSAVDALREKKLLQKRRGSPGWGGADRIRASKAGREACWALLKQEIQSVEGG